MEGGGVESSLSWDSNSGDLRVARGSNSEYLMFSYVLFILYACLDFDAELPFYETLTFPLITKTSQTIGQIGAHSGVIECPNQKLVSQVIDKPQKSCDSRITTCDLTPRTNDASPNRNKGPPPSA